MSLLNKTRLPQLLERGNKSQSLDQGLNASKSAEGRGQTWGFAQPTSSPDTNIRPKIEPFEAVLSHGSGGFARDYPTLHQGQELGKAQAAVVCLG